MGLLSEEQAVTGLEMIDDRNLTVHTYSDALAERIYGRLRRYADLLSRWVDAMADRTKER